MTKYYVYASTGFSHKIRYWKGFDSWLAAALYAKVNGCKLIAKGK